MYVYLYSFGAHVYLMYFLMSILMYICLSRRYFFNPFNGCSFCFKACLIYVDNTTARYENGGRKMRLKLKIWDAEFV
jgi:hypothetical protein